MRYLLTSIVLLVVVMVGVAGFRGSLSRRPPIEIIADMDRQAKLRPQSASEFHADRLASRFHAPNTIPRSQGIAVGGHTVLPFEDHPLNTGMVAGTPPGTTNFVELNPLPITAELVRRGRERYTVNCQPCHGAVGDGKGATTKYGMVVIANLHDPRIVRMTDGEIFNTVTWGKNLMQGYGSNVAAPDRWAVIAYVRALQLSRLAKLEEVPADQQAALKK